MSFRARPALLIACLSIFAFSEIAQAQEPARQAEPAQTEDAERDPNPPPADTWGLNADVEPTAPVPAPEPAPAPAPEPEAKPEPTPPPSASLPQRSRHHDDATVRYTLEAIEVRGNTRTSSRVILRYVRFKPGDVLDVDDPEVELTRFRLLGTGFFRDVQFSLKKGGERGRVVLVIDVAERNTIVINDISMGLAARPGTREPGLQQLSAYAALDVAETNLGGTGITLGAAAALAERQSGLRVRFLDPAFLGGPWMTSGSLLFNDALEVFGNAQPNWDDPLGSKADDPATVRYKRFGGSLGVGRDLSISTQLWITYRLETIDASYPLAASHLRGFLREPIDFHVVRGQSVLSTIGGTLQHDTRNHPFLPTTGWLLTLRGEVSLPPAALDYPYQKLELDTSRWWRLPSINHVIALRFSVGAIAGYAPFFEQFYVGDYTDFLPDRVLGMTFDGRPPPNFLGTDIVEVRYGDFAFRVGTEYRVPLYRGRRSIFGIDAFASTGIYGVAGRKDLTNPPVGYSGLALIPIDLTANLGLRMDTSAGGFVFAFSNVLSFIPVRGESYAGE